MLLSVLGLSSFLLFVFSLYIWSDKTLNQSGPPMLNSLIQTCSEDSMLPGVHLFHSPWPPMALPPSKQLEMPMCARISFSAYVVAITLFDISHSTES